jgi:hypothetical protein
MRRALALATASSLLAMGLSEPAVPRGAGGVLAASQGDAWTAPRTPWGDPDLQGIWTAGYIVTPLERPSEFAGKEFLTDEEVAALEQVAAGTFGVGAGAGRVPRPARGTDADVAGAYNDVFAGRGSKVVRTKRSSLIVDPKDGRIPPRTSAGQQRAARRVLTGAGSGHADNPEDRSPDDRCFGTSLPMEFGHPASAGGHSRIVQTSGNVAIYYEQNRGGTYRNIPVDGRPHLTPSIRQWLGDSIGHWEGDTLVVEVMNFSDWTNYHGSGGNLHLVERFARVAADTIQYRVTVHDPATFTSPWTIEVPLTKADEKRNQIFENACNEGNRALANILAGARALERETAAAAR